MKEILEFIEAFKKMYVKETENLFTCGLCYWFSHILATEFQGKIYYEPCDNHFVCRIGDKYYDIKGEWEASEEIKSWRTYQKIEPLESARIRKWCIDLKD